MRQRYGIYLYFIPRRELENSLSRKEKSRSSYIFLYPLVFRVLETPYMLLTPTRSAIVKRARKNQMFPNQFNPPSSIHIMRAAHSSARSHPKRSQGCFSSKQRNRERKEREIKRRREIKTTHMQSVGSDTRTGKEKAVLTKEPSEFQW